MAALHRLFVVLSVVICLHFLKPARGEVGQADGCTNGFMSVDRMSRVIDNYLVGAWWEDQAIFPGINFTCDGTIQSLTFGANLRGDNSRTLFPEIQLWRPIANEAGRYTLVDTINFDLSHRINTEFRYRIEGDSLLEFETGDVIGFYQPPNVDSRSRAQLAVRMPQPVQTMYYRNGNPNSVFDINDVSTTSSRTRNLLVSVTSDANSQCIGSGFLTNETLRTLVGLGEVGRLIDRSPRQQITPDMNFTCNGTITKWIVGALRVDNDIYPGPILQLWRKTSEDTYTKQNETNITSGVGSNSLMYEYTNFSPIPFQSGDVLGISVPRARDTILRLRFESDYGPTNYFTQDLALISQIQLSSFPSSEVYHALVSLEISVSSSSVTIFPTSSPSILGPLTTTLQPTSSLMGILSSTMMPPTSDLLTSAHETSVLEETFVFPTSTNLMSTFILTPTPSESLDSPRTPAPSESLDSPRTPTPSESLDSARTPTPSESLDSPRTPIPSESLDSSRTPTPSESLDSPRTPIPSESLDSSRTPTPSESLDSPRTPTPSESLDYPNTPTPSESLDSARTPTPSESLDSPNTPTPSVSLDSPRTPIPSESLDSPRTPTPSESLDSPRTPIPSESLDSARTPTPSETLDSGRTPTPSESLDSPRTPTPSESLDSPRTPIPSESLDSARTPTPSETLDSGRTPTPSESLDYPRTPTPSESLDSARTPTPSESPNTSNLPIPSDSLNSSIPPTTSSESPNIPNPPVQSSLSSPPPPGTSPPESQESDSLPVAAIGGGAGVGAILFVLLVVGGCLVVVCIRRKRLTKVELEHLPHNTDLRNPVYEGTTGDRNIDIHGGHLLVEDGTVYESPYTEYDTVNTEEQQPPPRKETLAEFDNPLYSDTGPVTFSEATFYEPTDYGGATDDSGEMIYYVPTSGQREAMEDSGNIYSTPETEATKSLESVDYAYVTTTTKTSGRKIEYFEESNIYWTPATNVSDLYEQLAQHKYREIPRNHVQVGSSLGSGQFGVVNRGKWVGGGGGGPVDVAIKTLRPGAKDEDRLKFLQEAAINGQFRHPNIVRLYGVVTVGEPVMIVLEFLPNGDLRQYLQSMKPQPSPSAQAQQAKLCLGFCQQISSGMCYLASKDFVHRDLAARNILVSQNSTCKVADFGMARDLEEDSYYISHGGQIPVKWTAPEALHYKKYSTASDVWSFGCLMYEIWSLGHKPFEGYTNAQVMKLVTEGYRLAPPPGCPRHIYSIMMNCWNPEKSQRPSFDSLCKSLKESSTLLQQREREKERESQLSLLGAPLETSKELYLDLQQIYLRKN